MRITSIVVAVLLGLPTTAWAGLTVVTTVPDLAAISEQVLGPHGDASAMVLPTQDPHFVDARPSLALELARADALVVVGLDLEVGWLPSLLTGARNPKIQLGAPGYIDASTMVTKLGVPAGPIDRAMGDIHPGGNPHFLYDPRNAAPIARGLAARFGALDPEHAADFTANAESFVVKLDAVLDGFQPMLASYQGAPIVSYHQSFPYLATWLGFEVIAQIEPKPGVPPSPAHVATVLGAARARGAKVVLQEPWYPETTASLVAEKAGARLVVFPGGTDLAAGQDYFVYLATLVERLQAGIP
jgi:zinc/manganese transport system substrate-binding protein